MKIIRYDKGDYGYQIDIVQPGRYPMYQVCCNDDDPDLSGVRVFATEAEVNDHVQRILRTADAWEESEWPIKAHV